MLWFPTYSLTLQKHLDELICLPGRDGLLQVTQSVSRGRLAATSSFLCGPMRSGPCHIKKSSACSGCSLPPCHCTSIPQCRIWELWPKGNEQDLLLECW